MYKIVVSRAQLLISITGIGFIDDKTLAAAAAELHAAVRSLGNRAGRHVSMYDLTEIKVATPAVVARFAAYFSHPEVAPPRRVALVSASPLVAQQLGRVSQASGNFKVFGDRTAAMAWLLADTERFAA